VSSETVRRLQCLVYQETKHPSRKYRGVASRRTHFTFSVKALAEAKIKQMTGGDVLKGRPLYGSWLEFSIIGKILLATNSLPRINNTDHGIWRRIQAIPFNRNFTAEEQDKDLSSKLNNELPGILNWAIKGYLDWQEQGLNPSQIVLEQV